MIRSQKRITLCGALIVLNIAFIWVNSQLPREVSAAFSGLVGQVMDWLFPSQGTMAEGEGNGILRKIAHFTEFCTLGALLSWMAGMLRQEKRKRIVVPVLAGVAVACVDETIQCFVPGRGPGVLDVLIDTAGVILGVMLIWLIAAKKYAKRRN